MPNQMFSFLNPLAVEIWLWMLGAYVLVSLTIWTVARFSPKEWSPPQVCPCSAGDIADQLHFHDHPYHDHHHHGEDDHAHDGEDHRHDDEEDEDHHQHLLSSLLVLENDFTLGNAFWFTIGSLMQQGSELNPKVTAFR
ncbi:hypothetical protein AAG570_006683 [Ranatra chinensis]|uniref:Ionotropic glutamate receptor C-terminal domain-containing protein n=1 Tax=Ranatra chinensis TaxID=642074 RepID=A0ABD0YV12_9HEMI